MLETLGKADGECQVDNFCLKHAWNNGMLLMSNFILSEWRKAVDMALDARPLAFWHCIAARLL